MMDQANMIEALKDNFKPEEQESENQVGGKKWLENKLREKDGTKLEDPDYDGGYEREESEDMSNLVPEKLDIGDAAAATNESDQS